MRKLYGDSLRKDAGFVKVIKNVASKNVRILESRAGKHAPELKRVAIEVKGTFEKVFEETADAVEDFLAKCKRSCQICCITIFSLVNIIQLAQEFQKLCRRLRCCCGNLGRD
jgi:hypothetical protein